MFGLMWNVVVMKIYEWIKQRRIDDDTTVYFFYALSPNEKTKENLGAFLSACKKRKCWNVMDAPHREWKTDGERERERPRADKNPYLNWLYICEFLVLYCAFPYYVYKHRGFKCIQRIRNSRTETDQQATDDDDDDITKKCFFRLITAGTRKKKR